MRISCRITAMLLLCLSMGATRPLWAQTASPAAAPAQPAAYAPAPAPAPAPGASVVNLGLADAVKLAVERNLDLKVELYNPAMGEADIRRNQGIFDPLVSASVDYTRTASPNTFNFQPFIVDQLNGTAGISQLLTTGGSVGVNANSGYVSNSASYFSSGTNFSVSQPLLRNFGKEATELNINVARFTKEGDLDRFRTKLSATVAQVRSDYLKLYNFQEVLAVQRTALALANRILVETKGRVKAGVLPAMEILSAEFSAATREKAVIDAERAVRDQMDLLRLELQLPAGSDLVLVDRPYREPYQVPEEQAVRDALQNRPELAAQRVSIRINDLQQRVARNRTLPDLNLTANVGTAGFAQSFLRSYQKTIAADDPVWGVGLQFSYPLGNRAAENDYIRAKLALDQSKTQLQSLESGVVNDVRAALRLVEASYKQIEVTSRGRAYAEERLRAFQKRNAVGLATAKDVFDVENDLVAAQGNEIQALVDYNNAITQLWLVSGVILDRQGIKLTEKEADALYEGAR
ncbi:RND transporter [Geomonas sp. Red276]